MTESASATINGTAKEKPLLFSSRSPVRLILFIAFLACLYAPGYFLDPYYRLPQFNRFLSVALFALSVDLIWGYTGLLSLGQGLYFGLGAYFVAYSLNLQKSAIAQGGPEVRYDFGPDMAITEFMFQGQLNAVPIWIRPLINIHLALILAVLVPTLIATMFGWIVFRRRIKGVYFSLITQALVFAFFTLISNQRTYTGGVDGHPGLPHFEAFGFEFKDYFHVFLLVTTILVGFALVSYALMQSKFGKIITAIRDNEFRVMALGYDTAMYKTFLFGFAGLMAAVAGVLFVCSNRSAGPQFFNIEESIFVVILVAVGGRGTLFGPILGALLVNVGQDQISGLGRVPIELDEDFLGFFGLKELVIDFTKLWPIILGVLFISVVLFLPDGIVGGLTRLFAAGKRLVLARTARSST